MPEVRPFPNLDEDASGAAWPGRLTAGVALSAVLLTWLAVLPFAALAWAGFSAARRLGGNERLRRGPGRG